MTNPIEEAMKDAIERSGNTVKIELPSSKGIQIPAEQILTKIKEYGPVSAVELAVFFKCRKANIQSAVMRLRKKGYRIKTTRVNGLANYEMEEIPMDIPKETKKLEEPKPSRVFHKSSAVDIYVDRCYYLIKALEYCPNTSIMENFNLSGEEARVLINKVAIKYKDVSVAFSANIKKH